MKQKVFIIFMLITLISLLLIACGQNEKKPDDPFDNAAEQRGVEEEEKRQKIAAIKKNGIPSEVIEILKDFHKDFGEERGDFGRYARPSYIWESIEEVLEKVPYKNGVDDNGNEFVYGDVKDYTTADVAARQAARDEVDLAFGYRVGFVRAFAELAKKLVETKDLLTKNKTKLKDLLIKIRKCAKAYYIDAYDTLEKNLDNLEVLSAAEVKSLHDNLALLKAERDKLVSKILQPFKDKYPMIREFWYNPASTKIVNTLTADEIETYWDTLSAEFDSICNEIIKISGEIQGILDNIKIKG
ncbi:virulence associated lipoprotein [Borrelia duttonii]|uniref:virulence associated lipoprotein n=1 Tax=Borrelia duttonii TaxID=40834 RepID=UPI0004AE4C96|nr:virulence associated lipoprotein [Borrelia duttonii]